MPVTLEQGRGRSAIPMVSGRSLSSPAVIRRASPVRVREELIIVEDEMVQDDLPVPQKEVQMVVFEGMQRADWVPPPPVWAEPVRMPCPCINCMQPPPVPPMPVQPGDWNTMFQIPPWAHAVPSTPWGSGYPEGMVPDPVFKKRRRRGRRGRGGRGKKAQALKEQMEREMAGSSSHESDEEASGSSYE